MGYNDSVVLNFFISLWPIVFVRVFCHLKFRLNDKQQSESCLYRAGFWRIRKLLVTISANVVAEISYRSFCLLN